jgi:hypothetical protein
MAAMDTKFRGFLQRRREGIPLFHYDDLRRANFYANSITAAFPVINIDEIHSGTLLWEFSTIANPLFLENSKMIQ